MSLSFSALFLGRGKGKTRERANWGFTIYTQPQSQVKDESRKPKEEIQCLDFRPWVENLNSLPWWLSGQESAWKYRRHRFNPWVGKIPWRRKWQLTPAFMDRGAWRVTVHGVAKSWTWLSEHAGTENWNEATASAHPSPNTRNVCLTSSQPFLLIHYVD